MDSFYDLYVSEVDKNDILSNKLKYLQIEHTSLINRNKYLEGNLDSIVQKAVKSAIDQVDSIRQVEIDKLVHKISQLESLLNISSDNSGLPTSQTPIQKKKRIPNSRETSSKSIGGQVGHKKSKLESFTDDEITDTVEHTTSCCSKCKGDLQDLGVYTHKDEFDYEIIVKKIRHTFHRYICKECGKTIDTAVPLRLKEENQYGTNVQALAITLMNQGYVSMNRTREIISGLSMHELNLSVGFIAKLQKRMALNLHEFMKELHKEIVGMHILHWDDTVIMIAEKRACLRFYGDKLLALYTAHERKNKEGLDKDGILELLSKDTVVVHDHNTVNYNDDYEFQNAECCVHLIRDLQKVVDNLNHTWAKNMIELITSSYHKRETIFGLDINQVLIDYDKEIALGRIENQEDQKAYYSGTEKAVLNRLENYKENYLMWAVNTDIPFSNNESERSLRGAKTKMKVSGQFQNIMNAEYFASIKSYLETGMRFGMNTQYLITRALEGNYCTIEEMKNHNN